MHEGPPTEPTPEESEERIYTPLTPEEEARVLEWRESNWTKDDQETEIKSEDLRESAPFVAEWEDRVASFEETYPLSELHAITEITPEESRNHPIREPAKEALCRIEVDLDALKRETNITKETFEKLKAEYKRLLQAVGMINKGKVDHTR